MLWTLHYRSAMYIIIVIITNPPDPKTASGRPSDGVIKTGCTRNALTLRNALVVNVLLCTINVLLYTYNLRVFG